MDQVRHRLRAMKRAYSTEKIYVDWILQYIRFHGIVHPKEMGTEDIDAFLTHLAVDRNVTASTQNQARSALVFLYSEVLKMDFKIGADAVRAKESMHLPVVMWEDEVAEVLQATTGRDELMLTMLYGGGLRGKELLSLRYKDIDFHRGQLLIRDAKGAKDRYTLLPKAAYEALKRQLKSVEIRLQHDLESGFPGVYLPFAIEEKYPNAACSLAWQFVFPARAASIDPRTGKRRLHHLHKSNLLIPKIQNAVRYWITAGFPSTPPVRTKTTAKVFE